MSSSDGRAFRTFVAPLCLTVQNRVATALRALHSACIIFLLLVRLSISLFKEPPAALYPNMMMFIAFGM